MKTYLVAKGNAFQIGATEFWAVMLAPGMDAASEARSLGSQLESVLPRSRALLPPTVPESVNQAFHAASDAMHGNGACNVEGKLWGDESGHHFEVQSMQNAQRDEMRRHQFEHELAKHNADCEVEKHRMQVQAEQAKYNVWFDGMKQLLKDGLITVKEFLEETRVK